MRWTHALAALFIAYARADLSGTGQLTHNDPPSTSACGACGIDLTSWSNTGSDFLIALNHVDWDAAGKTAVCGKKLQVAWPSGGTAVGTIFDMCPGCNKGDLDITTNMFAAIDKNYATHGRDSGATWSEASNSTTSVEPADTAPKPVPSAKDVPPAEEDPPQSVKAPAPVAKGAQAKVSPPAASSSNRLVGWLGLPAAVIMSVAAVLVVRM